MTKKKFTDKEIDKMSSLKFWHEFDDAECDFCFNPIKAGHGKSIEDFEAELFRRFCSQNHYKQWHLKTEGWAE